MALSNSGHIASAYSFGFRGLLVVALFLCSSAIILPAVKDTTLETYSRLGSYSLLLVGQHKYYPKKRFVIQFQDIPQSCRKVSRATMVLKYSHSHQVRGPPYIPPVPRQLCVHQILRYWNERTVGGTTYMNPGSDYDSNCLDTVSLQAHIGKGTLIRFDITAAAKNWVNGAQNYGILVKDVLEITISRDRRFYSSEAGAANRPYLDVQCTAK